MTSIRCCEKPALTANESDKGMPNAECQMPSQTPIQFGISRPGFGILNQ